MTLNSGRMHLRGWSVLFLASNVALIPYQPGFSRDFPIYYFIIISYIYLINRYLQVNFLVPSRRHKFDPYLKNLHLIHNYLHHTDQFTISACFQSFWSALFSAVSSPISTTMHYSPRLSQHIVRTTPRKLLSWELCLTSGWHWMSVTSPFFSFLTCLRRLTMWTMTSSLPDWIKHLPNAAAVV